MRKLIKKGSFVVVMVASLATLPLSLVDGASPNPSEVARGHGGGREDYGQHNRNGDYGQHDRNGNYNQLDRNRQNWEGNSGWQGVEPIPFQNNNNAAPQIEYIDTQSTPNYNPFPQEDYGNNPN